LTLSVNKLKDVYFIRLLNRYVNVLSGKLPAIRHVALRTNMGFISINKGLSLLFHSDVQVLQ
jgi:hypothetical protein